MSRLPAFIFALSMPCAVAGCSVGEPASDASSRDDSLTSFGDSPTHMQTIGNCWLYATTEWAAALANKAAPQLAQGDKWEFSPAYLSYWDWFEQLTNGDTENDRINAGGWYGRSVELILHYGLVRRGQFVDNDEAVALRALTATSASLKNGALKTLRGRGNHALIRRELDKAWGLSPEVISRLDRVFGQDGANKLDSTGRPSAGIVAASEIPAMLSDGQGAVARTSLADAIGQRAAPFGNPEKRTGKYAWTVYYHRPNGSESEVLRQTRERQLLRRIQKTLHRGQPVPISWYVEPRAQGTHGEFAIPVAPSVGGGFHDSLIEDYEVTDVPGYGTLPVGVAEDRASARDAALSDQAKVTLLRVKNSWGLDPNASRPGYNDLYLRYLDSPQKQCDADAHGKLDLTACRDIIPLNAVVLPAGVDN